MGDVTIWQPCGRQAFGEPSEMMPGYIALGGETPIIAAGGPGGGYPWRSNLRLRKHPGKCVPLGAGWACAFVISIRNTGPDNYFGLISISDTLPLVPGEVVSYAAPPWVCGGPLPTMVCHRPATFLPVNHKTLLFATVWVPNSSLAPGKCDLRNAAKITFAPGGSNQNTNAADDADNAMAHIPSVKCQRTNLKLAKQLVSCSDGGQIPLPHVGCSFTVTVTNEGPEAFSGPIAVEDTPNSPTNVAAHGAGWACNPSLPPGGATATCHTTSPIMLPVGSAISFTSDVTIPTAAATSLGCKFKNTARIVAPLGAPDNTSATDDISTEPASIPASLCPTGSSGPMIYAPPSPKPCPPGYRFDDGACKSKGRPGSGPQPKPCPKGTVGERPDCHPLAECEYGGRWPHCHPKPRRQIVCEYGGRWPHCHPKPRREIVCEDGGRWPRCHRIPPARRCPIGMIGQWPVCRRINPRLWLHPPMQYPGRPLAPPANGGGRFTIPLEPR